MNRRLNQAGCALLVASCILARASSGYAQAASTQPAADAVALLDKITAAYSKLDSAEFDGHVVGHFDIAGEKKSDNITFTSSFRAPNQFKHVALGDVVLGSTGQTAYAYQPSHNVYLSADAPKDRASLNDWPSAIPGILQQQNPAMLLALTKSPGDALKDLGQVVTREPDIAMDGVKYETLQLDLPDHEVVTMLIDPRRSLLRQVRFDLRKMMEDRGAVDVKMADVTVDYTKVDTKANSDEKAFAWNPPPGAIIAAASVNASEEEDARVLAMVGKPAPDFSLPGLDDKTVKLSSFKGSVVLVDFWATWCPFCVAEMPALEQLYKDQSSRGFKLVAVDQLEDRATVKTFLEDKKLTMPILFDPLGDVGKQYGAEALPATLLIGRDGIVKKVFVGEQEAEIKSEVLKEMGG